MAIATGSPAVVPGGGFDGGAGGGLEGGGLDGSVVAVAIKISGLPLSAFDVANSELPPPLPRTQLPTATIPLESVTALAPVKEPPPLRMLNVTVTPGTPVPFAAVTFTAGRIATAVNGVEV
jgi:hypothetical protein